MLPVCSLVLAEDDSNNLPADAVEGRSHAAYLPPIRPSLPHVKNRNWPRNAIDNFIARAHELKGMTPSPEPIRPTLIRRLSLDLIGLPPTPAESANFVNDPRADAVERLVDRLLASTAYGERMAVYWLDLVRYADSNGYHEDHGHNVYPYRDYVIQSFNENKGFDVFTIEQIAGDLLPDSGLQQKVASAYNRLNMISTAVAQEKQYLARYAADRVSTTASVWLGSTLACAECHDHKYDPFTAHDFYSFAAYFADIKERGTYVGMKNFPPEIRVPSMEQAARLDAIRTEIAQVRPRLKTGALELAGEQAKWELSEISRTPDDRWKILRPASVKSAGGTTLIVLKDHSVLASGASPLKDTYTFTAKSEQRRLTAFRLEVLPHQSFRRKGPGRAHDDNFVLTEFEVLAIQREGKYQKLKLDEATASFDQTIGGRYSPYGKWHAASAIDGDVKGPGFGWAVLGQIGRANHIVFQAASDLDSKEPVLLKFVLKQNHGRRHTIGRFRISVTSAPRPVRAVKASLAPPNIQAILSITPKLRSDKQKHEVARFFHSIASKVNPVAKKLKELKKQESAILAAAQACMVTESVKPRVTRVLRRGDWRDETGTIVKPATPHFLPKTSAPADRLGLARWLVDARNPLVARVMVNRLWQLLFGAGLIRTADDLGTQGARPTHPKLLDWLAVEFQESRWDVKHIVRLLATSATYRQGAGGPGERKKDPQNRWLTRYAGKRLEAEAIRDLALSVSGLLCRKVGGRSVRPYQPAGYWRHGKEKYAQDHGDNLYRRGLYVYWKRQFLYPGFMLFDAPNRQVCTATRSISITPLQSLILLNDPVYVEASRAFAGRILRQGGTTVQSRLNFAFSVALSRKPQAEEVNVLDRLVSKHSNEYAQDKESAVQVVRTGESRVQAGINLSELAAWTSVARVILNLPETITRK